MSHRCDTCGKTCDCNGGEIDEEYCLHYRDPDCVPVQDFSELRNVGSRDYDDFEIGGESGES